MAQEYIVRKITKVYELQSASIDHKHIEIIILQTILTHLFYSVFIIHQKIIHSKQILLLIIILK